VGLLAISYYCEAKVRIVCQRCSGRRHDFDALQWNKSAEEENVDAICVYFFGRILASAIAFNSSIYGERNRMDVTGL